MQERISLPKQKSPIRAIRMMCVECNGGSSIQDCKELIRDCAATACPLYEFRMGKNPYHGLAKSNDGLHKTRGQGGKFESS